MACGNDLTGFGRVCFPMIPSSYQIQNFISSWRATRGTDPTDKNLGFDAVQSGGLLNDEEAAEILQILTDDFTLVPRMARLEQQVAELMALVDSLKEKTA